ncbi:carbonic anhydrase 2-like [Mytilus trossulus]|uniref:carbonic anhydrase 2-like n=1 Tax=Mytilus trossulus TaxID=6551 RepID=UPI00300599EA
MVELIQMHVFIFLILLSFNSFRVSGNVGNIWGYQDGVPPQSWPRLYPECSGRKQSPINIDTRQVVLDTKLEPFDFSNINTIHDSRMTIVNHGKTVEVEVLDDNCFITGGGLHGRHIVKQFHFHWGNADHRGSEHDVNGKQFPMEMHIVSYSSRFRQYKDALNSTGALAVISFLIDIGGANTMFDEICDCFAQIIREDDNVTMPIFSMTSLFPSPHDVYYRYYGSLTTPPCLESVIWTVFKSPISISKQQINLFRFLGNRHINKHRDLADNFRPLQALYGRKVYTNNIRGMPLGRGPRAKARIVKITKSRYKGVKLRRKVTKKSKRQFNLSSNRKTNIRDFFPNTNIMTARNKKSLDKYINKLSNQLKTELRGVNGDKIVNRNQLRNLSPIYTLYDKQVIRIPHTNKLFLTNKYGINSNRYHKSKKVQQRRKYSSMIQQRTHGY